MERTRDEAFNILNFYFCLYEAMLREGHLVKRLRGRANY